VAALAGFRGALAETREQIISREDPAFHCRDARLTVGRDGLVYLTSGHQAGYVLRLSRDGRTKHGSPVVYATHNATANTDGVVATANAHFNHALNLYDKKFRHLAAANDFLVSDQVGWDAPAHVEAGASGDFYGVDQHRDRMLRVSPWGRLVTAYPIPHEPQGAPGLVEDFRVSEQKQTFYLRNRQNVLRCVGFDGQPCWKLPIGGGAFDVTDDGTVFVIAADGSVLKKYSPDGQPTGEVTLQMGELRPVPGSSLTALRIAGAEAIVKRLHETELFQTYDLASGTRKHVVSIEHEKLTVTFPSLVWTAGQRSPLRIEFVPASIRPHWRVWAATFGTADWRELSYTNGEVQIPDDFAGLYVLKISPEVQPRESGQTAEYVVREVIEVRQPGRQGTVNVFTPSNRTPFGRGEEIPASVLVRTAGEQPRAVALRLVETPPPLGATSKPLWETPLTVSPGKETPVVIPATLTRQLRPARYRLTAAADGLTSVPQPLEIGPGIAERSPFFCLQYGDYGQTYPHDESAWSAADTVGARVDRVRRLGMNLFVDRLGVHLQYGYLKWANKPDQIGLVNGLTQRLSADPVGVAPQKAQLAPPLLQTMAAYSAANLQQMAILMGNDAGLPLGTGFDNRKPDQVLDSLRLVTNALRPYRAFRGWDWASNWWVFNQRGSAAAQTPAERSAYEAALKRAQETGVWDVVLDRVADRRWHLAVEAQALFQRTFRELVGQAAGGNVAGADNWAYATASACPFRNVESYPPVSLENVDEADLQAQWEQIALPYHAAFGVDFYKRPGKRAWGHPEIWNDPGTGEQIVPTLFQLLMRGADGIGCSGGVPPWGPLPDDPRTAYYGTASVYRAVGGIAAQYGPWLRTLENNDHVAIAVSGRMFKIDDWTNTMGRHFARVFEAYISCLAAHHPASIVFAEDLKPDALTRFRAVLVVDQRVAMEPPLVAALRQAQAAHVAIFHDDTCRAELVKDFTSLKVSFNKIESGHQAGSDMAYPRLRDVARANALAIRQALDPLALPVAGPEHDEVFVTERKAEEGRYLFVVNNTLPPLDPGLLWRVTVHVAATLPVQTPLSHVTGHVYDVFALRPVQPQGGVVHADLRTLPARVFAVLPAAIDRVEVQGTLASWTVRVLDPQGQPIRAAIPIQVRLLSGAGEVVEQRFLSVGSHGVRGQMVPPGNVAGPLVLEARELFSGKSAQIEQTPGNRPGVEGTRTPHTSTRRKQVGPTDTSTPSQRVRAPGEQDTLADASCLYETPLPVAQRFGPHIRDMVLTANDSLAVMNTMNWDHNLYAVDVNSGQIRWRQRVGHYYAFAPQSVQAGVAVQGFRLTSAEGYHLYLVDAAGRVERGFGLYGVPQRLPHRFVPSIVRDRINQFAVPRTGDWVATAGDLGLAVWSRDGRLRWSQDWWKTERHTATLATLDTRTLLVIEGMRATAYDATSGQRRWQLPIAPDGEVRQVRFSSDGRTIAVAATTQGGRVFILRDGQVQRSFPTAVHQMDISADGSLVAVATGHQMKLYSTTDGLRWLLHGDDQLQAPRMAPDGRRTAISSALGTLYVLDTDGKTLLERDLGALAVPAWLPDGDLLVGTWMGRVSRLDRQYAERWSTRLSPSETEIGRPTADSILADDKAPITRISTWGNAADQPLPLTPNLLSPNSVMIRFVGTQSHIGLARDPAALVDGRPDAPAEPWLDWGQVESFAETSPFNYLVLDAFHTRLQVKAITLVEDPAHPESWLRDALLEGWDTAVEKWTPVQPLLSNTAVHTHVLAQPVEAARFRLTLPWGLCGNLRLGEIVLHGERLGCSHPDAAARRGVAVLFDEQESDLQCLRWGENALRFKYDGAYSGTKCLQLAADKSAVPTWQPPFGHRVPNWDFEVVEKPEPGQYRYLEFAWRALAPETKGLTLRLAEAHFGGVAFYAGQETKFEGATTKQLAASPPQDWQVVRVDLWDLFKRPMRIGSLGLGARGGPAAFDRIRLARTERDLAPR
jgi:outer membrane protein assembly factor BamB